tara:strand:- start:470 stop:634 length:165 start_codon:yes stop_codon:yes gene_type:complete
MNLKERGITVGDLLILVIVLSISFFAISKNKYSNDQKSFNELPRLNTTKSYLKG